MNSNVYTIYFEDACQDLSKYQCVDMDRLNFTKQELPKIQKLNFLFQLWSQKKKEIQILEDTMIDIEMTMGDMLRELPKRKRNYKNCHVRVLVGPDMSKSRRKIIQEMGLTATEVRRCELLSEEKEMVNWMRYEADQNNRTATIREIMHAIREKRGLNKKKELTLLPLDPQAEKARQRHIYVTDFYKKFNNALLGIGLIKPDKNFFSILGEFYKKESMVEYDINRIGDLVKKLIFIQNVLLRMITKDEPENSTDTPALCEGTTPQLLC